MAVEIEHFVDLLRDQQVHLADVVD
jgi:hypothetical protein